MLQVRILARDRRVFKERIVGAAIEVGAVLGVKKGRPGIEPCHLVGDQYVPEQLDVRIDVVGDVQVTLRVFLTIGDRGRTDAVGSAVEAGSAVFGWTTVAATVFG